MITVGILLKVEAKAGKEQDVANFLKGALAFVEQEPETVNWYSFKVNENTFGIFDTFPNEDGRKAHLAGKVAEELMKHAPELLASAPVIEFVDIMSSK